jgi:hypothetical protein
VDKNAAQPYTRVFSSATPLLVAPSSAGVIDLSGDVTARPMRIVDPFGRTVGVMRR